MRRWFRRNAEEFDRPQAPADIASGHDQTGSGAAIPPAEPRTGDPAALAPSAITLATGLRLPRRLDVAFDRHLIGEGWHHCETDNHLPFRWMGLADTATVWLAVDRSVDLAGEIAILIIIDQDFWDEIRVAVGEPPEPVAHKRTADGVSFVLPRAPDLATATRIELRARGRAPASETDQRCLSIACSIVRVRPLDTGIAEDGRLTLRAYLAAQLSDRDAAVRIIPVQDHREIAGLG